MMLDSLGKKLLQEQNECTLSWITRDGSPASTVVSFIYEDNCLWMTAIHGCSRDLAITRDNRVSVVVSGKGCKVGDTRCISMRGTCEILRDEETRNWFFPKFSRKVLHKSRIGAKMMSVSMNNSSNVVLKFSPQKIIPYDAQKMMKLANLML